MEINFVNGSKITTLDDKNYKPSDAPMMIFGIDLAKPDSEDYSCVSYYCSKCKEIVTEIHTKKGLQESDVILPANCPHCGVRFKGWIQA